MSLKIYTKDNEYDISIGANRLSHYVTTYVQKIVADGKEYTWIMENIEGIPKCKRLTIGVWFGDDAKFIVAQTAFW